LGWGPKSAPLQQYFEKKREPNVRIFMYVYYNVTISADPTVVPEGFSKIAAASLVDYL
jgi:hypothetical protein